MNKFNEFMEAWYLVIILVVCTVLAFGSMFMLKASASESVHECVNHSCVDEKCCDGLCSPESRCIECVIEDGLCSSECDGECSDERFWCSQ